MKKAYLRRLLLLLLLCTFMLGGCKNKEDISAPPEEGESCIPLVEMYPEQEMPVLDESFDLSQICRAVYSRDECDAVETTDAALIEELIAGLRELRVTGEYKDGVYVTDSSSDIFFYTEDGTYYGVFFDFGKLSIKQKLYTYTGGDRLDKALDQLLLMSEP